MKRKSLKEKVLTYKNKAVLNRYCETYNVDMEVARQDFRSMLIFLYERGTSNEEVLPSETVIQMWHVFLLFTQEYDDFCFNLFGKKIHHNPDVEISEERKIERIISNAEETLWPSIGEYWLGGLG